MVDPTRVSLATRIMQRLNLRFPSLFLILGLVTLLDLLIPDFIPFADEIGLALLTLLFGSWKNRKAGKTPASREIVQISAEGNRAGPSIRMALLIPAIV